MNEIWKDIKDYPNYQVSNLGRVRNKKGSIRKTKLKKDGYISITLCKNGEHKTFLVHRLVATAFIPNPNNYTIINHINEDKTDNRAENLEWCTAKYNINYGTHNERTAKTLSIPILQFTKSGKFVRRWDSATEVERDLGFNQGSISRCLKGKKYKSVGGYKWCYHYKSLWLKNHIPLKDKKVA